MFSQNAEKKRIIDASVADLAEEQCEPEEGTETWIVEDIIFGPTWEYRGAVS